MNSNTIRHRAALLLAGTVMLGACAPGDDSASESETGTGTTSSASAPVEERRVTPRLAITHDGGVTVVDGRTLETVADLPAAGFVRVAPAGDGRHVLLSETEGFRVLDMGTWAEPHGDHSHFYTADPSSTDVVFEAEKPGHVVRHDGRTVLFADGSGVVTSFESGALAEPGKAAQKPKTETYTAPDAHHGVAVERGDHSLLVTVGTEKARSSVVILDRDRREVGRTDQCPGVHGEGAAAGGAVMFGCEDGPVVVRGNEIRKVATPTPGYARTGNAAATEAHRVVLGDYKVDKEAELERPTRVSLIDTDAGTMKLVELPASYSFRSLARGRFGEALVLGTDGHLRVLDPDTGQVVGDVEVTRPWTEPEDWQEPRPAVYAQGDTAYVTDPATKTIKAVTISSRSVAREGRLAEVPNETTGVTGGNS
ncbi:zinc metallochaperone AztD [Tsukamurella sp. 8F]|uniref:zinc metallochaperone AztD n=1 Tax=unclassified Tsukamurella TaxID=2633480 RepID=UPI0023B991A4|nr:MULTISPECIES: zinc metallochaperone AztD [unclassified Tsukamurella]MDF0528683.1 zinc metallochaperone AztD [Tsukamurella sp. 8J]MDF0585645.1 zinc metallochaperone AztD [Tsukamurella sp. 8F]